MSGAGQSQFDIVSQGLIRIGEPSISSYAGTVAGEVASNIYPMIRDNMLTEYRWHFATGKKALSRLTDAPLNEWRYAFQLPTDILMLIRTYPGSLYEIYEDKLYSNNFTAEIDYLFRATPGAFPAYFVEALSYKFAAVAAVAITNNQSLADRMEKLAVVHLKSARFKDSQGRPNVAIQSRPWIEARGSG